VDHTVLHIEDELDTTTRVEETLLEQNVHTLVARSTGSAWPIAEDGQYGFALIDQRLPTEDDGMLTASDEQVFDLACRVGEQAPFVWLTAHVLTNSQMEIGNCRGVINKAGDVATAVKVHTLEAFPDLMPDIVLDEVMVELSKVGNRELYARVPAWKPDVEFRLTIKHLEPWVVTEVRGEGRQYFRARAWLGAARPGQLDLSEWQPMTQPDDVEDVWDDAPTPEHP
jgi:hypothetical protein